MSGFGAIAAWGDQTLGESRTELLTNGIAHRGPDGSTITRLEQAVLVHAQFATTPEAQRERQPTRHCGHEWWLVADARIDNGDDLRAELLGRVAHPLDTDADLILAAYEHWGIELAPHLLGDFGFAIWDAECARLLVVRDHVGVRPVYWAYGHDGSLVAASTLRSVLEASGLPREPDLVGVADRAVFAGAHPSRTVWSGVTRLPGGHTLVADGHGHAISRYWHPGPAFRNVDVDTAAAEVRRLFDEAVRCRMRATSTVGVEVSGGFDSTSVAATAVGEVGVDGVFAASLAFPGMGCDETAYVDAASTHLALPIHRFNALAVSPYDFVDEVQRSLDTPTLPDSQWTVPLKRLAAQHGCRVVLTGQGGDHLLYGDTGAVPGNLLMEGHPKRAYEWLRLSGLGRGQAAQRLARALAGELTRRHPSAPATQVVAWVRRRGRPPVHRPHPYLGVALATVTELSEPEVAPLTQCVGPSWPSRASRSRYYLGAQAWFVELWDRSATEAGVEGRHPFLDVRLIEYVLSLGEDIVAHGQTPRGLHRAAMAGRLPPALLNRIDKAEFSDPWHAAALLVAAQLESQPGRGTPWLDEHAVRSATARIAADRMLNENTWPWWGAVATEWWRVLMTDGRFSSDIRRLSQECP